jgi:hypothetical protein
MNKTKDFEFSITLNACAPFIKFGKMFPLVAPETGSREKEMSSASRKSVPKPRRLESQSESKFSPEIGRKSFAIGSTLFQLYTKIYVIPLLELNFQICDLFLVSSKSISFI